MRPLLLSALGLTYLFFALVPARAETLPQLFKKVKDSVVIVRTVQTGIAPEGQGQLISMGGLGSGVIIASDGKILTAAHVVQAADRVGVEFPDGRLLPAKVIASEPAADIALLQVEGVLPQTAVAAEVGDSDRVEVGEQIFIVGAPFGISHTLTVGHISARHTRALLYAGFQMELFQTDAAINQGNSGGPMFNLSGQVVGIVSHIISRTGAFEGLGFVVTANMARRLLLEKKTFWSGLEGYLLVGELAKVFNLPQPTGMLVQRVAARSPADLIGLRPGTMKATIADHTLVVGGDIILAVQGIELQEDGKSRQEILTTLSPS